MWLIKLIPNKVEQEISSGLYYIRSLELDFRSVTSKQLSCSLTSKKGLQQNKKNNYCCKIVKIGVLDTIALKTKA